MEIKDITTFQSSLRKRQVVIAMAGTMLAMFSGSLYMTVVATAMPRVVTDLGGFSQYTWVFTSYFIAEVIAIPERHALGLQHIIFEDKLGDLAVAAAG